MRAAHVAQLPVLSFRLAQHSESLQLPLDALLLPPESAGGSRVLCIKRHPASTVDGLASYSYGDGPRESLMYDVGAATSPSQMFACFVVASLNSLASLRAAVGFLTISPGKYCKPSPRIRGSLHVARCSILVDRCPMLVAC